MIRAAKLQIAAVQTRGAEQGWADSTSRRGNFRGHVTPWIAARHTDAHCDHIHVAVVLRRFDGQPLIPTLWAARTDRNHIALARMLGLEAPVYFNPDIPTLAPPVPARRLTTPAHIATAKALSDAFTRHQPETPEALDALLAQGKPAITRIP